MRGSDSGLPDEIMRRIALSVAKTKTDISVVEIGGTAVNIKTRFFWIGANFKIASSRWCDFCVGELFAGAE